MQARSHREMYHRFGLISVIFTFSVPQQMFLKCFVVCATRLLTQETLFRATILMLPQFPRLPRPLGPG